MLITNLILFQLAWFSCVAGAAYQMPWLGVFITLAILSWHLSRANQVKPELLLIILMLIIGACFDQLLLMAQWVEYQSHGWNDSIVPVWILALWVAFASTLNVSLAWMQGRYLIAMLFGTAGGPIAYFGADKLGAVTLNGSASYIALSVGWAVITPLLLYLAKYLNGFKAEGTA
ncbi:MAG: DUF2878 domain-containing protein [Methylotenera sp.]